MANVPLQIKAVQIICLQKRAVKNAVCSKCFSGPTLSAWTQPVLGRQTWKFPLFFSNKISNSAPVFLKIYQIYGLMDICGKMFSCLIHCDGRV